jgi:hypothetical protein
MSFIVLDFRTDYRPNKEPRDMVLIAPAGEAFERTQVWHPVESLRPTGKLKGDMGRIQAARWSIVEPAYNAWKKGEEVPENGTPLAAWPGVNQDQAKYLRTKGILSVEQVRDMSDSTIETLPFPGRRDLPKLAKMFLEGQKDADLAAKNTELLERVAAMEEMLLEKQADEPKKRGPGRPRKAEADAA